MNKQEKFSILGIMVITYIVIPMIESVTVDDKNAMSQLNDDDTTGSHVNLCCQMVLSLDYAYRSKSLSNLNFFFNLIRVY